MAPPHAIAINDVNAIVSFLLCWRQGMLHVFYLTMSLETVHGNVICEIHSSETNVSFCTRNFADYLFSDLVTL